MNANMIRAALVALLLAGGLSTACRLTTSVSHQPTQTDTTAPASGGPCKLGHSC